jgi:hypothetical protein
MLPLSRCLSAAGFRFLGVLFPPGTPASLTVGLPAAPRRHRWTLTGFPRSARMRCGRAGCPLYPGSDGVPCDHRDIRGRRLPPCNGWLLPPRYCRPTRDVRLTRHQQGFRVIHPSGLPLTCDTRSERAPLSFPLGFAPGRYQPRTPGRGRVWNTNPKSRPRHHAEPPINEPAHNVRPRVALPASAAMMSPQVAGDHCSAATNS